MSKKSGFGINIPDPQHCPGTVVYPCVQATGKQWEHHGGARG